MNPIEQLRTELAAAEQRSRAAKDDPYAARNHRQMVLRHEEELMMQLRARIREFEEVWAMAVAETTRRTGLPPGVQFAGPQNDLGVTLIGFTDVSTEEGTTLWLLPAEATPERIAQVVAERRASMAAPLADVDELVAAAERTLRPSSQPLPPLCQRAPRVFLPVETAK